MASTHIGSRNLWTEQQINKIFTFHSILLLIWLLITDFSKAEFEIAFSMCSTYHNMVRSAKACHQRVMSFPIIFLLLLIAQEVSEAIIRKIKLDKAVLQAMYGYYMPRKAMKFKNDFQVLSFFLLKLKKFTSHVINKLKVYTKKLTEVYSHYPCEKTPDEKGFLLNWAEGLFRWGTEAIMTGCSS